MHIGIDATPVWGPPVGQYTYMACLVRAMLQLESDHRFTVYCRREIPDIFQGLEDRADFHVCRYSNRKFCEQVSLPLYAREHKLDLLHNCWCRPVLCSSRTIFTIHGLEWRTHPDIPLHSRANLWYYRTAIESQCRRATRLIAISEFIRETFETYMHVPADRMDVIYHGVDPTQYYRVTDLAEQQRLKEKYKLPERYLLFVGAMVANKNLVRLLEVLAELRKDSAMDDVGMVIVGGSAWNSAPLQDKVRSLGLTKAVTFTGFVPAEDIPGLYTLATTYAFPSLVEGFGLPVLEAFACGTPVLTSNVTAMAEVAGEAAITIDPLSHTEMADGLRRLLTDEALRTDLSAKGLARAADFTWERTARQTLAAYEKALG